MIAPLNVSKGQENKATSYRFGDDERELTAEEKEAYKMAGNIAEKIHYAGQAAAVALFMGKAGGILFFFKIILPSVLLGL